MSFTPTPSPNPWVQGINILINLAALGYAYWDSKGGAENVFDYQDQPASVDYRQLQVLFDKNVSFTGAQERELFNINLVNLTAGDIDNTWTTADYTGVEARFNTWWTAQKTLHPASVALKGYKWYSRSIGVPQAGENIRLNTVTVPGTGAGDSLPPQIATSVTLETGHRKHWGRVYLPAHVEGNSDQYGRPSSSFVDACALNFNNLMAGLSTDQTFPVIVRNDPAAMAGSPPAKIPLELMTITGLHVDDVADVIRRRRYQTVNYRRHYP